MRQTRTVFVLTSARAGVHVQNREGVVSAMRDPNVQIEDALRDIQRDYRPGLLAWIRERPSDRSKMRRLEGQINRAVFISEES